MGADRIEWACSSIGSDTMVSSKRKKTLNTINHINSACENDTYSVAFRLKLECYICTLQSRTVGGCKTKGLC